MGDLERSSERWDCELIVGKDCRWEDHRRGAPSGFGHRCAGHDSHLEASEGRYPSSLQVRLNNGCPQWRGCERSLRVAYVGSLTASLGHPAWNWGCTEKAELGTAEKKIRVAGSSPCIINKLCFIWCRRSVELSMGSLMGLLTSYAS